MSRRASSANRAVALGALCVLGAMAGVRSVVAQAAGDGAPSWQPPAEIAAAIRGQIEQRWGVAGDSLHIAWGDPQGVLVGPEPKRLLGPGRGGSWIALFESESGRASVRFRAGVRRRVPVATIDLPRGHKLTEADIEWAVSVAWGAPPPRRERVGPGWTTRRPVSVGEPLLGSAVTPPAAVASGAEVLVRLTAGSVTVEAPGRAIGKAALGETVLVRLRTGLRVRGVATEPDVVEITDGAARSIARAGDRGREGGR